MTYDENAYDRYHELAMRSAYRSVPQGAALTPIEQAALLPLAEQWRRQGTRDRFHASVPVLREDGAAQMTCLTVAQVEAYGHTYSSRAYSIEACHEPEGDAR